MKLPISIAKYTEWFFVLFGGFQVFQVLQESQFSIGNESFGLFWTICHWPTKLVEDVRDARRMLCKYKNRFMANLKEDQAKLEADIATLQASEKLLFVLFS